MGYTLGQAARATGKSKPTIQRAVKSGKISAGRKPDRTYDIDPAELHRVYAPVTGNAGSQPVNVQHPVPGMEPGEIKALREMLADRNATIADLRGRLDHAEQERSRLTTMMLEDKRPWWQRWRR